MAGGPAGVAVVGVGFDVLLDMALLLLSLAGRGC